MSHSNLPTRISRLEDRLEQATDTMTLLIGNLTQRDARTLRTKFNPRVIPASIENEIEGDPAAISNQLQIITKNNLRENLQMASTQLEFEVNTQWYFRQILGILSPENEIADQLQDMIDASKTRINYIVDDASRQHEEFDEKTISPKIEFERLDIANELDFQKNPKPIINRTFTITANMMRANGDICHQHLNTAATHINHLNALLRIYIIALCQRETTPNDHAKYNYHQLFDIHAMRAIKNLSFAYDTLPQGAIESALIPISAKQTITTYQIH